MEAEGAQLRQALTSRAAEGSLSEAERCRQAEQLLAQQVRPSLTVCCSHQLGMVKACCQYYHNVEVSIAALGELLPHARCAATGQCI